MKFFIFFRHWADVFGLLSTFWRVCWNCILRVHRNTLGKKMSSETNTFPLFLDKNWIFFQDLVRKKLGGVIKNEICRSKEKLCDNFFWKVILPIFFGHWSRVSRGFLMKISASLSKLHSLFQRKLSEKNFSLQNLQFVFFWKIERKNFVWLSGNIQEALKLLSTSPGKPFEKKVLKNFCNVCRHFFRSLPVIAQQMFGGPVKIVIYVSIGIIWKEKLFWKTT